MKDYCKTCFHDEVGIGFCDKCYYNHILEEKGIPPTEYEAKPKPITNADRIRAMSDEELAEYHAEKCGCPHDPIVFGCRMATIGCIGCWLDWLRQEAPHD